MESRRPTGAQSLTPAVAHPCIALQAHLGRQILAVKCRHGGGCWALAHLFVASRTAAVEGLDAAIDLSEIRSLLCNLHERNPPFFLDLILSGGTMEIKLDEPQVHRILQANPQTRKSANQSIDIDQKSVWWGSHFGTAPRMRGRLCTTTMQKSGRDPSSAAVSLRTVCLYGQPTHQPPPK